MGGNGQRAWLLPSVTTATYHVTPHAGRSGDVLCVSVSSVTLSLDQDCEGSVGDAYGREKERRQQAWDPMAWS